jgi:enoyl-CoA hydratase/carnithine racemase
MNGVLTERHGPICVLTLNRPERRNAITAVLTAELRAAVAAAEADDEVAVTVLTGSGSVFCAGMDLVAYNGGEGPAILSGQYGFAGFVRHPRRKPCIAALNGPAIAGGFEVMLACDLAVAEEHTYFAFPEVSLGLIAAAGGLVRLPRRVPLPVALGVLLSGERIEAREAERWGLVNAVVGRGQALETALKLAKRICTASPQAIRASLQLARLAVGAEDAPWAANDATWAALDGTADTREGPLAFTEHRVPMWHS